MTRLRGDIAPALLVLGMLLCAVPAIYLLDYFLGSEVQRHPHVVFRTFRKQWQSDLYKPAARAESAITGVPVELRHYSSGSPTP